MRFSTLLVAVCALAAWAAEPQRAVVTLLATTDLHGHIYPVDYFTGKPARRGLAKIAALASAVRAENPRTLLVDVGDTIQGSPLESVYQTIARTGRAPLDLPFDSSVIRQDPMMLVMNAMGYDAMAVGNHEFNFGLANLEHARSGARFPWISANIEVAPGGRERPFAPYIVKTLEGVKVAVIGITTPAVPSWEKPEQLGAYRFGPARPAVERAIAELRRTEKPDLIVAAVHAGLERPPSKENIAAEVAEVPGIDAIVFGHSHREIAGEKIGDVLLVQPKNFGGSLARLDFTLERATGGPWRVVARGSRLLPVTDATPADTSVLALAQPYHELAERYLNTPVAEAPAALDGRLGRVEDSALVDAIHTVQLHYANAEVSFTSLFNPRVMAPKGPVTVRQIAALYLYDNELYAIEGTGRMVKEALENAARYFVSCAGETCGKPPLINPAVMGFNYDTAAGVEYDIDLTRPEGDRIRNLTFRGRPLQPGQKLRIAINNYRAAGSGGYGMFAGAKLLWRSGEDIRDLMVRYYTERHTLPARADGNWRIVPPEARATLAREAR